MLCIGIDNPCLPVVHLVDVRIVHERETEHTARDLALAVNFCLAVLEFASAECVVLDFLPITTRGDVIHDLVCIVGVRCRVMCSGGELRSIRRQMERHIISCDHTRRGSRRGGELPACGDVVRRCSVVLLRRMGRHVVIVHHAEVTRVNVAAVDCPLAVDILLNRIVSRRRRAKLRAECLSHIRILHIVRRAVTGVDILDKCRIGISAPVGTLVVGRCGCHFRRILGS